MPNLFIPIPGSSSIPFAGWPTTKGQLYALDLQEKITFQYNPKTFKYGFETKWSRITYKGDFSGGDLDFNFVNPINFDLELLFIADPGAPLIDYDTYDSKAIIISADNANPSNHLFDYDELIRMFNFWWKRPVPGLNRPSRIQIVMGSRTYNGVITEVSIEELEYFKDLSVKEAKITLTFEEWNLER